MPANNQPIFTRLADVQWTTSAMTVANTTTDLTAGTSYSFTGTVNSLSVNKTIGSSTQVNLPSNPSVNDFYVVKDRKGDSNTNPITISGGTNVLNRLRSSRLLSRGKFSAYKSAIIGKT
jgi:hypothetical protein